MDVGASVSGVGAIQQAFDAHSARAGRLAQAMTDVPGADKSFVKDMAELNSDPKNVGIQAKAVKAKDEMVGALLDILA